MAVFYSRLNWFIAPLAIDTAQPQRCTFCLLFLEREQSQFSYTGQSVKPKTPTPRQTNKQAEATPAVVATNNSRNANAHNTNCAPNNTNSYTNSMFGYHTPTTNPVEATPTPTPTTNTRANSNSQHCHHRRQQQPTREHHRINKRIYKTTNSQHPHQHQHHQPTNARTHQRPTINDQRSALSAQRPAIGEPSNAINERRIPIPSTTNSPSL